ncbi:MAG: hypothetical protein AB7F79_04770 [Steroidobacteraceae bacterium]
MIEPIDANAFRIRVEAKINIIAKALTWILAISIAAAIYFVERNFWSLEIDVTASAWVAFMVGSLASWLIINRPMRKLEATYSLYDDDEP